MHRYAGRVAETIFELPQILLINVWRYDILYLR